MGDSAIVRSLLVGLSAGSTRLATMDLKQIPERYQGRAEGILESLQSYFVDMPRGENFLEGPTFRSSYETFRSATSNGEDLSPETLLRAVRNESRSWVVIRAIAGVTPPEAAALTMEAAAEVGENLSISAEVARRVDARCRRGDAVLLDELDVGTKAMHEDHQALTAMVTYLPAIVSRGPGRVTADRVHRFDKVDTRDGQASIQQALRTGGEMYPELLYERILGRPFATHRDAVSDKIGDALEDQIMDVLMAQGIKARKTASRQKIASFPQAPDILVPYEESIDDVKLIVEAKLAEDDGTARDKVARVKALRANEDAREASGEGRRQVVAVLGGRGFGVRPPDLTDLLVACDGFVYAAAELEKLVLPGGPFYHLISGP
jgi:hypothetical protein